MAALPNRLAAAATTSVSFFNGQTMFFERRLIALCLRRCRRCRMRQHKPRSLNLQRFGLQANFFGHDWLDSRESCFQWT